MGSLFGGKISTDAHDSRGREWNVAHMERELFGIPADDDLLKANLLLDACYLYSYGLSLSRDATIQ